MWQIKRNRQITHRIYTTSYWLRKTLKPAVLRGRRTARMLTRHTHTCTQKVHTRVQSMLGSKVAEEVPKRTRTWGLFVQGSAHTRRTALT